jgi:hypothetical protein
LKSMFPQQVVPMLEVLIQSPWPALPEYVRI